MTLDELLSEISYQLPKGYPTIVDGKFVDKEEVLLINKFLLKEGIGQLPLPEAKPAKQSTNILTNSDVDKLLRDKEIRTLDITKRDLLKVKGISVIVLYATNVAKKDRSNKLQAIAKSVGGTFTDTISTAGSVKGSIDNKPYYIVLKEVKEEKTDTDLKEGMSVVVSNVADIEAASPDNVVTVINKLLAALSKTEGLSDVTLKKIEQYLTLMKAKSADPKLAKKIASILNENISQGNSFKVFLDKNPDFRMERGQNKGELFTDIRSVGAALTGLPADKWCPGDVYFIRRGSEDIIRSVLNDASSTDNKEAALTKLNSMFSTISTFNEKVSNKHDIVAVSLKQSSAQGGKLKSAFEQYEGAKTDYNITPVEMKYPTNQLKKSIELMRNELKNFIASEKVTEYRYDPVNLSKVNNPKILRGKFGAYKALSYIMKYIAKKGDSLDDALVGLTAYGFGIVKKGTTLINPPFLKLIADAGGAITVPQYFKPGRTLALLRLDGGKKPPQIEIIDTAEYGGIKMYMTLQLLGDTTEKIKYEINYRYNGGQQLTIELGKPVHIG